MPDGLAYWHQTLKVGLVDRIHLYISLSLCIKPNKRINMLEAAKSIIETHKIVTRIRCVFSCMSIEIASITCTIIRNRTMIILLKSVWYEVLLNKIAN